MSIVVHSLKDISRKQGMQKGSRKAEHSGIMGILLRIHPYIEKCRLCCMPVK